MGFPKKLLNPGEEVAVDVRPHWKCLFGPVFSAAVVLIGGIAALVASAPQWAEWVLAIVLLSCLFWLAVRYVRWTTTSFVVTNERLVLRNGILRRSDHEILIDRLTDISCNQSLGDRLLRCGDVLIESPGRDSPEVFHNLPHPMLIQNEIYRLIEGRRNGAEPEVHHAVPLAAPTEPAPVAAPPAGGSPTLAEQLDQLDNLRKRGVISRKEFAAKKADLLSRM
jgi:membrane protein YdbS with pleckstrin-like domain